MGEKQAEKLERRVQVQNKFGIHVRPSTRFVEIAQGFKSNIRLKVVAIDGEEVEDAEEYDGKSVMQLLQLAAGQGTELILSTEGEDAEEAINSLEHLIESRFGFEE